MAKGIRHPRLAVALGACALTLVTVFSVTRCYAIHPFLWMDLTEEELADEKLDTNLTDQRVSYDMVTRTALKDLSSYVWATPSGNLVIKPSERCLHVWEADKELWRAYVIVASFAHEEKGVWTYALAAALADGYEVWTLEVPGATVEEDSVTPTLRGACGADVFSGVREQMELAVDGPPESALVGRGTTLEAVHGALASWCEDHCPDATAATWDLVIGEDHQEQSWWVGYTMNDARHTHVRVHIAMDTGALKVRKER